MISLAQLGKMVFQHVGDEAHNDVFIGLVAKDLFKAEVCRGIYKARHAFLQPAANDRCKNLKPELLKKAFFKLKQYNEIYNKFLQIQIKFKSNSEQIIPSGRWA
jgi:hypothetical protein